MNKTIKKKESKRSRLTERGRSDGRRQECKEIAENVLAGDQIYRVRICRHIF
jgi:hypothetical protein